MVEFALVLPILILVILGIIEMGYALFVYTQVQNAAREGARAAAVRPCPNSDDILSIVQLTRDRLPALVDTSTITPTLAPDPSVEANVPKWNYGKPVTVTVQYQFELLDPIVTSFIPQVQVHAVASRTFTTACGALADVAPTPIPTVLTQPGGENGDGSGTGDGSGDGELALSPTPEPTPEPIDVTLAASKETNPNVDPKDNKNRTLTLRVRVYQRGSGIGVGGKYVKVNIQSDSDSTVDTVELGPTDGNGYADSCDTSGVKPYKLKEQLTVSTQQVDNPPGGQPAPPVSTTLDPSGAGVCQ
ncbi:MAG: hypothetical protein RLZZ387_5378 [Chloroflexota bacterium]|jgi:hypothetical protein